MVADTRISSALASAASASPISVGNALATTLLISTLKDVRYERFAVLDAADHVGADDESSFRAAEGMSRGEHDPPAGLARVRPIVVCDGVRTSGDGVAVASPFLLAIVADRGDRYFSPLKWEKRHVW